VLGTTHQRIVVRRTVLVTGDELSIDARLRAQAGHSGSNRSEAARDIVAIAGENDDIVAGEV
jgi:hypothetical protein